MTTPSSSVPPVPRRPRRTRSSTVVTVLTAPASAAATAWLVLVTVAGVFASSIAPHDPLAQNLARALELPSGEHLLGTDTLGRDVLSRLIYGGASVLLGIGVALGVAVVLGVVTGLLAGYLGRWPEAILTRINDALLALPGIIILLLVVAIFGTDIVPAMIALGVLLSAQFFRLARIGAQQVRSELFVDASIVAGLSTAKIVIRHITPNMMRPIIVQASLSCAMVIFMQAGVSFLGLGPPPPSPQWGSMVLEASSQIYIFPWLMVPTGFVIIATALSFNAIGDTLTDSSGTSGARSGVLGGPVRRRDRATSVVSSREEPSGSGALLELEDLTVAFEVAGASATVIDRVSFTVKAGETVAIVGESGCGKTVTGLAVAGLLAENARILGGEIRYDGRDLVTSSEADRSRLRGREIAFIPQEPVLALDPSFTVLSQLVEPMRKVHGMAKATARKRARELLDRVGIADPGVVLQRYPHQLSGGMAQRVAIAIALVGDPRLIVADEPTTALDVTIQAEVISLLREIVRDTGAALVLVTHDLGVVADVANSAVVMYAGQVVETAPVEALFGRPQHPYSAALLRSAPRLAHVGTTLPTIPGMVPPPSAWPYGCRFANRCPIARPECEAAPVPLVEATAVQHARCLHPGTVTTEVST